VPKIEINKEKIALMILGPPFLQGKPFKTQLNQAIFSFGKLIVPTMVNIWVKSQFCNLTHKIASFTCLCFQFSMANLCFLNERTLENQQFLKNYHRKRSRRGSSVKIFFKVLIKLSYPFNPYQDHLVYATNKVLDSCCSCGKGFTTGKTAAL
jgi:hypothetical protein